MVGSARRQPLFGITAALVVAVPALAGLQGCKIVSIAEDQAMRERMAAGFDATRYVDGVWTRQALPYWTEARQPLPVIVGAARADLDAAGAANGRRAGDGSPWTFVVTGQGVVEGVEAGRRGRMTVRLPNGGETVVVQTGPVVSGSALRDSLPFVHFNDFSNQLVYADVAQAFTGKGMAQVRPAAEGLKAGDAVAFEGVLVVAEASVPLLVTPYRLTRVQAGATS